MSLRGAIRIAGKILAIVLAVAFLALAIALTFAAPYLGIQQMGY
jgi:hypothetical protein